MAPPHTVTQVPIIPGWITAWDRETERYTAARIDPLTDYQRQYGCLAEVEADDARELEVLCVAQLVLAVMISKAEPE